MQTMKEIALESLCEYDQRNPYVLREYDGELIHKRTTQCACNSCFYGKTELAEIILRLLPEEN